VSSIALNCGGYAVEIDIRSAEISGAGAGSEAVLQIGRTNAPGDGGAGGRSGAIRAA
jgi:hypothetical protein